jgi:hypothetical protein
MNLDAKLDELRKQKKAVEDSLPKKKVNWIKRKDFYNPITENISKGDKRSVVEYYTDKDKKISRMEYLELKKVAEAEIERFDQEIRKYEEVDKEVLIRKLASSDSTGEKGSGKDKDEHILIKDLLDVVIKENIPKYSLRNLEKPLSKTKSDYNYSQLGNLFKIRSFRTLLYASIERRKKRERKPESIYKLETLLRWVVDNYERDNKQFKAIYNGKKISDFGEGSGDRKGGTSGVFDQEKFESDFDETTFGGDSTEN